MSPPPPPVVSADGRFYWDGGTWVPLQQIATIVPAARRRGPSRPLGTLGRMLLLVLVVLASLMAAVSGGPVAVLLLGLAAVLGFIAVRPHQQR